MNKQKNKVNMEKVFATVISLSIMVALVVGIVSILKSNKSGNEDKKNYIDLNQMGESNGYADGETDGAANGTNNSYANSEAPTEKDTALHASGGEGTSNGNEKQTTEPNKTADGKNNGNDKQPSGTKPDETDKAADNGNKVPSSGGDTNVAQGDAGSGEKDVAASSGNEGTKNEGDAADSQQVAANVGGATESDNASGANGASENGAPEGGVSGNAVADNASGNNVADADNVSGPSEQTQSSDPTSENSDFVWDNGTQTAQGEAGEDGNSNNIPDGEDVSGGTAPVNAATASLLGYNFGPESTLMWPTQGDVILNYNMANTVYFPTLDMYRCNPAIIIRAEEGAVVCAAADGIVMDVKENKEIGLTVKIAVGNEYVLTYGQLKDIVVGIGSQVRRGDVIGSVAAPSQYYLVEGANLYFRVDNADGSVNPMDFIEAQ